MDNVTTTRPAPAALIACGHLPGAAAGLRPDAGDLPCFQALGPWGEPDAGLPWFRIGAGDDAAPAPGSVPAATSAAAFAGLLHHARCLLLVIGSDHDAIASALAIATLARGRGIHVMALLPGAFALPDFQRRNLARQMDYVCECPPGADLLVAAQVLWSSMTSLAQAGDDLAAMTAALAGTGYMTWRPLDASGAGSLQVALQDLPPLRAGRCLWAVVLQRDGLTLADWALARRQLRRHCRDDAALVATSPRAGHLPDGLFVFTA